MKNGYPIQSIETVDKCAKVSFSDDYSNINDELKITPMVFCFLNKSVVLSFDKTDEWNSQCGHRNKGESVEDCIVREAYEEAGVSIDSLSEFGCMKYETLYSSTNKYPPITYIPVFTARVIEINELPSGSEVHNVVVASHKKAQILLSGRSDNKLLLSVYNKGREIYLKNVIAS